jgi:hypothetical protein
VSSAQNGADRNGGEEIRQGLVIDPFPRICVAAEIGDKTKDLVDVVLEIARPAIARSLIIMIRRIDMQPRVVETDFDCRCGELLCAGRYR